jgi:ankyrin repeat protein
LNILSQIEVIGMKGSNTMNELLAAIAKNDKGDLARLLNEGVDLNAKDRDGRTALMHAVIGDKNELIDLLIKNGADVNAQDNDGFSPLHFAAQDFRTKAAGFLLRAGAQVNLCDKYGNTPLWRAVFNSRGRGEVIRLLLEHGADRLLKNKSGKTPVDLANNIGNYDVKQFLLNVG